MSLLDHFIRGGIMKKFAYFTAIIVLIVGAINVKSTINKYNSKMEYESTGNLNGFISNFNMIEEDGKSIIEVASQMKAIKDFSEDDFDSNEVLEALTLLTSHDEVQFAYVANRNNTLLSVPNLELPSDYQVSNQLWFTSAISTDEVIYTDIFLDVHSNDYVITVAKALNEDTVVSMSYSLNKLDDLIMTLDSIEIYTPDGDIIGVSSSNMPIVVELIEFKRNVYETNRYKYYLEETKLSKHLVVYRVDKALKNKLLISSVVQRVIVFLILSTGSYISVKLIIKSTANDVM